VSRGRIAPEWISATIPANTGQRRFAPLCCAGSARANPHSAAIA
jgi:hypothetical protein